MTEAVLPLDKLRTSEPLLLPFERACWRIVAAMLAIVLLLASMRQVTIDVISFAPMGGLVVLLLAISATYRRSGRAPNIPLALVACATLVAFTNVGAVLNYLLAPVGATTLDHALRAIDGRFGYDWTEAMALVEARPVLAQALKAVYQSSLPQLTAIILLLGLTSRRVDLHEFLACGIVASLVSILFWSMFPSIGPAAWVELPQAPGSGPRVVGEGYVMAMHDLLREGPQQIDANSLRGVIAFPSMHTVMMGMSIYYVRNTRWLPLFVAINLPMIPAILTHGGHHLADVFAGVALFFAAAVVARKLVGESDQVQTASGGRLIRIASMLPPVLRPNSVPRS